MKRLGLLLLALATISVALNGGISAAPDSHQKSMNNTGSQNDSTRVAGIAKNIFRSVRPGGQLSKAIAHIDTITTASDSGSAASLDITVERKDLISWVYLDTSCTIVKLLFNDTLSAGRYRFYLNPTVVGRYFYKSDIAYTSPQVCWQILRVGSKQTIDKTMVPR